MVSRFAGAGGVSRIIPSGFARADSLTDRIQSEGYHAMIKKFIKRAFMIAGICFGLWLVFGGLSSISDSDKSPLRTGEIKQRLNELAEKESLTEEERTEFDTLSTELATGIDASKTLVYRHGIDDFGISLADLLDRIDRGYSYIGEKWNYEIKSIDTDKNRIILTNETRSTNPLFIEIVTLEDTHLVYKIGDGDNESTSKDEIYKLLVTLMTFDKAFAPKDSASE